MQPNPTSPTLDDSFHQSAGAVNASGGSCYLCAYRPRKTLGPFHRRPRQELPHRRPHGVLAF
jgi:hypothetical protein